MKLSNFCTIYYWVNNKNFLIEKLNIPKVCYNSDLIWVMNAAVTCKLIYLNALSFLESKLFKCIKKLMVSKVKKTRRIRTEIKCNVTALVKHE